MVVPMMPRWTRKIGRRGQPLVVRPEQHVGRERRRGDAHGLHRHEQRLRQRQHGDVAALRVSECGSEVHASGAE